MIFSPPGEISARFAAIAAGEAGFGLEVVEIDEVLEEDGLPAETEPGDIIEEVAADDDDGLANSSGRTSPSRRRARFSILDFEKSKFSSCWGRLECMS